MFSCGVFWRNYVVFVHRNYTHLGVVFLIVWTLAVNSFLDLAFILVVTIHRERDFVHFRSLSKNSNIGGTWEVHPVKFRGFGRSVFVFSTEASGLGVGVGTQNGAVSFFSILVFSMKNHGFAGFPNDFGKSKCRNWPPPQDVCRSNSRGRSFVRSFAVHVQFLTKPD